MFCDFGMSWLLCANNIASPCGPCAPDRQGSVQIVRAYTTDGRQLRLAIDSKYLVANNYCWYSASILVGAQSKLSFSNVSWANLASSQSVIWRDGLQIAVDVHPPSCLPIFYFMAFIATLEHCKENESDFFTLKLFFLVVILFQTFITPMDARVPLAHSKKYMSDFFTIKLHYPIIVFN